MEEIEKEEEDEWKGKRPTRKQNEKLRRIFMGVGRCPSKLICLYASRGHTEA